MPLETTVVDLWRLVYDYNIPTVVMLNQDTQKVCFFFNIDLLIIHAKQSDYIVKIINLSKR